MKEEKLVAKETTVYGLMVDGYKLIDYITKEKPDLARVEMYVRNHMYPGSFTVAGSEFKERDELHFHSQVPANKIDLSKIEESL